MMVEKIECPSCDGHGTTDYAYLAYNTCNTCEGTGRAPKGSKKESFSAILSASIQVRKEREAELEEFIKIRRKVVECQTK